MPNKKDELIIDGKKFESRLIMGTSLYPNLEVLNKSLEVSGTEIITVSIRRFNQEGEKFFLKSLFLQIIKKYKKLLKILVLKFHF